MLDEESKPLTPEELYARLNQRAQQRIKESQRLIESSLGLLEGTREIIERCRPSRRVNQRLVVNRSRQSMDATARGDIRGR
jgi:hypothetical protein